MYKYNIKFSKLLALLLAFILLSCSDVVSDNQGDTKEQEPNDLVKIDDVGDDIDTVDQLVQTTRLIYAKGLKGQFKKSSTFEVDFGDTAYTSLIGDYSETEIIVKKEMALPKSTSDPKLVKSTVSGESLNEFATTLEFNQMTLEGYIIDTGDDTLKINVDPIDNFIVAKMAGEESIEAYEKARDIVLADLGFDSTFVMNQTFDDADITPENAGKRIAVAGLVMRATEWDFEPSEWDIIPYENAINEKVSFKYWLTDLGFELKYANCEIFDCSTLTKADSVVMENMYFNTKIKTICDNAQTTVNSLDAGGIRNLARFNISDEVKNECIDYLDKWFKAKI